MPSTSCGVMFGFGVRYAERPFPEHSMKQIRVVAGKRFRSSSENSSGLSTSPCMSSAVLRRIDDGDAVVVALEVEVRRRDRSAQVLQRRECRSRRDAGWGERWILEWRPRAELAGREPWNLRRIDGHVERNGRIVAGSIAVTTGFCARSCASGAVRRRPPRFRRSAAGRDG